MDRSDTKVDICDLFIDMSKANGKTPSLAMWRESDNFKAYNIISYYKSINQYK